MKIVATFAALLAASVTCLAADVKPTAFKDLDKDHDKKVSGAEAQAYNALSETFQKADTNADGFLTTAEYDIWLRDYVKKSSATAATP